MRRVSSKQGMIESNFMFFIFDYLLAIIVIIALFSFITSVGEKTLFEKNFLVRDITTTMNAMYAAPGTMTYTYPFDYDQFLLTTTTNGLIITDNTELDGIKVSYPVGIQTNIPLLSSKADREGVQLIKGSSQFLVESKHIKRVNDE